MNLSITRITMWYGQFLLMFLMHAANVHGSSDIVLSEEAMSMPIVSTTQSPGSELRCKFGNESYELTARWRPNLGPPFGILNCVRCGCILINRKKGPIAKVRCINMKQECPLRKCRGSKHVNGSCCKVCPDEDVDSLEEHIYQNKLHMDAKKKKSSKRKMLQQLHESSDEDVAMPARFGDLTLDDAQEDEAELQRKRKKRDCVTTSANYTEGSQWRFPGDHCRVCHCARGSISCEQQICPELPCHEVVTVEGQCCPVCRTADADRSAAGRSADPRQVTQSMNVQVDQRRCVFEADNSSYVVGSRWYPYIPPFGFDKCAVCRCTPDLVIECKRKSGCASLRELQVKNSTTTTTLRPDFKTVPVPSSGSSFASSSGASVMSFGGNLGNLNGRIRVNATRMAADQNTDSSYNSLLRSPADLLADGGCHHKQQYFANGDLWHPNVQPFGEMRSIRCHCKDRKVTCRRLRRQQLTLSTF